MTDAADRGDNLNTSVLEDAVDAPETLVVEPEVTETPPASEQDEKPRDQKGKFIPKGRFDEAVGKERAAREVAERKLAELQATIKQVDRNVSTDKVEEEIVALEKEHSRLLLDGDADKAAEVMRNIRYKERSIALMGAEELSAKAKNEAREEIRMDAAIEGLESAYPVLDPNSEDFDQEIVEDVLGWQRIFIERDRMNPSAALIKASTKVLKAAPAAPEAVGLAAGKSAQDRKGAQVAKNVAAAKAQPASMKDSGIDSDKAGVQGKVDVSKLSREEFAALPEATKAKLRGDLF